MERSAKIELRCVDSLLSRPPDVDDRLPSVDWFDRRRSRLSDDDDLWSADSVAGVEMFPHDGVVRSMILALVVEPLCMGRSSRSVWQITQPSGPRPWTSMT